MKTDKEFTDEIRRSLQQSETEISPEVIDKLTAARRAAVGQLDKPARRFQPEWLMSGIGAAATAVVVAVLLLPIKPDSLPGLNEAEMVAAMDMELLNELEFLVWMLEEDANGTL